MFARNPDETCHETMPGLWSEFVHNLVIASAHFQVHLLHLNDRRTLIFSLNLLQVFSVVFN